MIDRSKTVMWGLPLLSAVFMSIPWLVPHCGAVALVALVPLLIAEDHATATGARRFSLASYSAFVLWNALTTFWVCNATVGGGLASIFVMAAVPTLIFALFRIGRRHLFGVTPYLLLASAWIAWERWCLVDAQIMWPWLVLGNAFADSTGLVQWYEYTGTLGGSLWIWAANLGIFGILKAVSDGRWASGWNHVARAAAALGITLVIAGPLAVSAIIYSNYEEKSEGTLDVCIGQPNFDPYHKFESMTQAEQTDVLLDLFEQGLRSRTDTMAPVMLLAPETFTSDIMLPEQESSPTLQTFRQFMRLHPGTEMLFGASAYEMHPTRSAPSKCAREWGGGWLVSRNSAVLADSSSRFEIYHKSRLVVGTELTPYPDVFIPLESLVCRIIGQRPPLMGRCEGQEETSLLHFGGTVPVGCAVCYESIFGEHCTSYVKKGAAAMTVITNDAWWGDTPGYRQHFNYSRLRAIELRRDFARCGNTGVSAFIDQKGDVVSRGPWWKPCVMNGVVNLNHDETFFVRHGDMVGRVCTFVFLLLAVLLLVLLPGKRS